MTGGTERCYRADADAHDGVDRGQDRLFPVPPTGGSPIRKGDGQLANPRFSHGMPPVTHASLLDVIRNRAQRRALQAPPGALRPSLVATPGTQSVEAALTSRSRLYTNGVRL